MSESEPLDPQRVGAEIEAEADDQRRRNPEIARLEREIEQVWADLAAARSTPAEDPGQSGLLDQAAALAALDPQVPVGSRWGLRGVKWLVRKLTYWYMRFVTDQFNVFAGLLIRHLRSVEARLGRLEDAAPTSPGRSEQAGCGLLDAPPAPTAAAASCIAGFALSGPCLVLSAGDGLIVEAIGVRGMQAHGVEQDPQRVLAGLRRQIDLRTGDVLDHLAHSAEGEFGTIVLTGAVELLPLTYLVGAVEQARLKLGKTGRIIVAAADPALRGPVESELGAGLGISPAAWRHLLERAGFDARIEPCPDPRITDIVVADIVVADIVVADIADGDIADGEPRGAP